MRIGTIQSIVVILLLIVGCGEEQPQSKSSDESGASLTNDKEVLITGQLQMGNEVDTSTDVLEGKLVKIQDQSGNTIDSGYTDNEGNYSISVPTTLAIDAGNTNLASKSLTLSSIIEDDGNGNVLGVSQPISIAKEKLINGVFKNEIFTFSEVSAVKGTIKFIKPDGSENLTIPKIGTDVYLPGFSFLAKANTKGDFLLLYIPEGDYDLRVEKNRFEYQQKVSVTANTTLNLETIEIQTDTDAPITTPSIDSTDFKNDLCISLTPTESAKTYFSTDGSNPTATDPFLYPDNCITISGVTTTLKYFSVDVAGNPENIKSQTYFYNDRWADPNDKAPPTSQLYLNGTTSTGGTLNLSSLAKLWIDADEPVDVFYTLDGSTPTVSSSKLIAPIEISSTSVLKYLVRDYSGNLETLKEVNINILDWKKVSYTGSPPNSFNNLIFDSSRNQTVGLVSDASCTGSQIETWVLSGSAWSKIDTAALTTCGRGFAINTDTNDYFMFTYPTGSSGSPIKAYKYNFGTNDWDFVLDSANQANGVSRILPVYDPTAQEFVLIVSDGGSGESRFLTFSPGGPSFTAIANIPSTTICDAVYDANRSKIVGYGKCTAMGSSVGDVYEYSAGTWSDVTPSHYGKSNYITYNSNLDLTLTFGGGYATFGTNSELWGYDGTDWKQMTPPNSPPERTDSQIIYDSISNRTIIYGGKNQFGTPFSDMWELSF